MCSPVGDAAQLGASHSGKELAGRSRGSVLLFAAAWGARHARLSQRAATRISPVAAPGFAGASA